MIKIDLITGFLGSGKTTFIKLYAEYLIKCGFRVGIVVNDFGPVNIDRILLNEIEGDNCTVEMVTTGINDDSEAHSRRFKTKLISLKMQGFNRVLVEPSGIYDIREFFDCLQDDPLYDWYEAGNVISLVDADLEKDLSEESEHYLSSQISAAGTIVFSKADLVSKEKIEETRSRLLSMLEKFSCKRSIGGNIIDRPFSEYDDDLLKIISESGYEDQGRIRPLPDTKKHFSTFFYTNFEFSSEEEIRNTIQDLMSDTKSGRILRIKGFIKISDDIYEVNASHDEIKIERSPAPLQQIIIVIGELLSYDQIAAYLE
ncbi:MAG: GTP-binding protein [Lachnospiraceae bacterium]|nr:GTP-binding protein [Lachnospiraceae bacterium]